jgi:hypothetical protein
MTGSFAHETGPDSDNKFDLVDILQKVLSYLHIQRVQPGGALETVPIPGPTVVIGIFILEDVVLIHGISPALSLALQHDFFKMHARLASRLGKSPREGLHAHHQRPLVKLGSRSSGGTSPCDLAAPELTGSGLFDAAHVPKTTSEKVERRTQRIEYGVFVPRQWNPIMQSAT